MRGGDRKPEHIAQLDDFVISLHCSLTVRKALTQRAQRRSLPPVFEFEDTEDTEKTHAKREKRVSPGE